MNNNYRILEELWSDFQNLTIDYRDLKEYNYISGISSSCYYSIAVSSGYVTLCIRHYRNTDPRDSYSISFSLDRSGKQPIQLRYFGDRKLISSGYIKNYTLKSKGSELTSKERTKLAFRGIVFPNQKFIEKAIRSLEYAEYLMQAYTKR